MGGHKAGGIEQEQGLSIGRAQGLPGWAGAGAAGLGGHEARPYIVRFVNRPGQGTSLRR